MIVEPKRKESAKSSAALVDRFGSSSKLVPKPADKSKSRLIVSSKMSIPSPLAREPISDAGQVLSPLLMRPIRQEPVADKTSSSGSVGLRVAGTAVLALCHSRRNARHQSGAASLGKRCCDMPTQFRVKSLTRQKGLRRLGGPEKQQAELVLTHWEIPVRQGSCRWWHKCRPMTAQVDWAQPVLPDEFPNQKGKSNRRARCSKPERILQRIFAVKFLETLSSTFERAV